MKIEKAVLHLWRRQGKEVRALRTRGLSHKVIEQVLHLRPGNGMTAWRLEHEAYSQVPKSVLQKQA